MTTELERATLARIVVRRAALHLRPGARLDLTTHRFYLAYHPASSVAPLRLKALEGEGFGTLAGWRAREWALFPSPPTIVDVTLPLLKFVEAMIERPGHWPGWIVAHLAGSQVRFTPRTDERDSPSPLARPPGGVYSPRQDRAPDAVAVLAELDLHMEWIFPTGWPGARPAFAVPIATEIAPRRMYVQNGPAIPGVATSVSIPHRGAAVGGVACVGPWGGPGGFGYPTATMARRQANWTPRPVPFLIPVEAGGAFAADAELQSDRHGRAIALDDGVPVLRAVSAASAVGDVVWASFVDEG